MKEDLVPSGPTQEWGSDLDIFSLIRRVGLKGAEKSLKASKKHRKAYAHFLKYHRTFEKYALRDRGRMKAFESRAPINQMGDLGEATAEYIVLKRKFPNYMAASSFAKQKSRELQRPVKIYEKQDKMTPWHLLQTIEEGKKMNKSDLRKMVREEILREAGFGDEKHAQWKPGGFEKGQKGKAVQVITGGLGGGKFSGRVVGMERVADLKDHYKFTIVAKIQK